MHKFTRRILPPLMGLSLSLVSVATFGFAPKPMADSTAPAPPQPVRPVLECVTQTSDTTFTAYFGYLNPNAQATTVLVGAKNRFTPNPIDRGQPVDFLPSRQQSVFAVNFNGGNLVWQLQGRTSTASRGSKRCVAAGARQGSWLEDTKSLVVFPNPADGEGFNVQMANPGNAVPTLTTLNGQTVQIRYRAVGEAQLEVRPAAKLNAGLYILKVAEGGTTHNLKVLIR